MTLGGLALAVGILVDDATVTIENIERHLRAGESLESAIMTGAGRNRLAGVRPRTIVHLHRLRADVLPERRRGIPVRAAGRGGCLRGPGVLRAVPHARADAGDVGSSKRLTVDARAFPSGRSRWSTFSKGSSIASKPFGNATATCSGSYWPVV